MSLSHPPRIKGEKPPLAAKGPAIGDPCRQYVTPPALAKLLGVNVSKVLAWIASGELEAIDVSHRSGIGRPRWRITAQAVERFEQRRSSIRRKTYATPPRRRQPAVVRYV